MDKRNSLTILKSHRRSRSLSEPNFDKLSYIEKISTVSYVMGQDKDNVKLRNDLLKMNLSSVKKFFETLYSDLIEETSNMAHIIDKINDSNETSEAYNKIDQNNMRDMIKNYGIYRNHIIELITIIKRTRLSKNKNVYKISNKSIDGLVQIITQEKNKLTDEIMSMSENYKSHKLNIKSDIDEDVYNIIDCHKSTKNEFIEQIYNIYDILDSQTKNKIISGSYESKKTLINFLMKRRVSYLVKIMIKMRKHFIDIIKEKFNNTDLTDIYKLSKIYEILS